MEWTRLELSKASVLRKEVDNALRLLARASEASAASSSDVVGSNPDSQSQNQAALSLSALAESMQARAREIEAFYQQNDHDERSILFEKQRLRLRRALQSLNNGGLGPGQAAGGSSAAGTPLAAPTSPAAAASRASARNAPPAASPSPQQPNRVSAPVAKTPTGASNSQAQRTTPRTNAENNAPASTRRTPAQVNESSWGAWSVDAPTLPVASAPPIRTRITTDMGSFIPSSLPGIYVSDGGSTDPSGVSAASRDGLIDMQIILTPEEFRAYVSRRKTVASANAKRRLVDKLCSKPTMTSPLSVAASGPYVDPKRIQKELFRPEQPHKWVGGPNGFKPSH